MTIHCDFDFANKNPIFKQNSPAYDDVPSKLNLVAKSSVVSVDMTKTFISDNLSTHCDLDLEDNKPIFLHDTLAHDNTLQYQVRQHIFCWFRRYCVDKHILTY